MRLGDLDRIAQDVRENNSGNYDKRDWTSRLVVTLLESAPTIDAVPVVRCHECANHSDTDGKHYCKFWRMHCPDDSDFFCKAGKRKEADHEVSEH